MLEDLSDPNRFLRKMRKDIKRTPVRGGATSGGGDSDHFGEGVNSLLIGYGSAEAAGSGSVALGRNARAVGDWAIALGDATYAGFEDAIAIGDSASAWAERTVAIGVQAYVPHDDSVAIGAFAATSASNQIMLGTSSETVVVPGTFSNPSARRLKQNIIPAPLLSSIFPDLVEYEYIDAAGRKRLGYIADDLVGTDAERFVTFDDDGQPSGIDYLSLLIVQNAQLHARLTALENSTGD